MINSFGTGKPTEADGNGRGTGKRTEAAEAVRLFGLFGCSGCSAVRAVRAAAALLPRMASGERQRSPHRSRRPRKAHWRAQRSPTPKKQLFCCAAVLLSFCGPGLRPCRLWHSSRIHRSRDPGRRSGERQRSPTCRVLLFSLFVFVLCTIYY